MSGASSCSVERKCKARLVVKRARAPAASLDSLMVQYTIASKQFIALLRVNTR